MTPHQIKLAANLWLHGKSSNEIAESLHGLGPSLQKREAIVASHIEAIKTEARLMKARAA